MTERLFRYYREDFAEPPIRVVHMDLLFDVFDDRAYVTSDLHAESRDRSLTDLALNAKNLEIVTVSCRDPPVRSHAYHAAESILNVEFGSPVPAETPFILHTESICRPTKNLLEGLYFDETPAGAPPQLVTQCQQWGFQRLVPCIDEMTAKCTYTTTIIADQRYTHLLSNGDLALPRTPAGPGRVKVTYRNEVTPMAPYLYFLGCGTWAGFRRDCEYPGQRSFALELLAPVGADPVQAADALDILHDAVIWVHLFTGPERYEKATVRDRLYQLIRGMERIRKRSPQSPQLAGIRAELAALIREISPGYAYTGSTYREIAMQNSDFGGMENVGNTTISANRIMPFAGMTDPAYEYLVRVKAHEFYHNLNGSEVTGRSPFEIWLNEAVTVHVENQYHAFHFGGDYSRLQTVLSLIAPAGTLELDGGAASLPIEPEGFNDPNELITDITYKKAPEFIRMVETLVGKEAFVRGLDLYHRRYRHGNASRAQWIGAMEEVSGQPLASMAEGWLKQTGFPTLAVRPAWDRSAGILRLHLRQEGDGPGKQWIFPVKIAIADAEGNDIAAVVHRMEKGKDTIELTSPARPAFVSVNREYSFYGRVAYRAPLRHLYVQARRDRDTVGRYLAFMTIMDREKIRLLEDPLARPDTRCIALWFDLFSDRDLMLAAGSQFMTIFESVPDPRYACRYQALYEVRERILSAIASRYRDDLLGIYSSVNYPDLRQETLQEESLAIRRRQIKNTALSVLARLDEPAIHRLEKEQLETSLSATDRLAAFSLYMDSAADDRHGVLDAFERESKKNPVSWENFLAVIGSNSSPEALDLIARVERSDAFRIEQANDQRALYGRFALNRKKSLQTDTGRAFLEKTLFTLAAVNEYTTVGMMRVFGPLDSMEEADQVPLAGILARLLGRLDPGTTPSIWNTARRILTGAPGAVRRYEQQEGAIPALQATSAG